MPASPTPPASSAQPSSPTGSARSKDRTQPSGPALPAGTLPLAELLPGTWHVVASSFPMWARPDRLSPSFAYGLLSTDPLVFDDTVSWFTRRGRERRLRGTDRADGAGLVWRGRGILSLVRSHWSVTGTVGDDLMAIRFAKTIATPAGVDVLVREGNRIEDIREELAANPGWLGLTHDEVASLVWLRDLRP